MQPPSAEMVVRHGPALMAALAVPIAGFAASSLFEKNTEEENLEQEQEIERRASIVRDMVKTLEADEQPEQVDQADQADCPDDDYDDLGQIEYSTLKEKCWDLAEIRPGAKDLVSGIEWCGKLLLKELQNATTKTEAQKDVRYSDGRKLENLLDCPLELDRLAMESRYRVPTKLRSEIRIAYRHGLAVQQRQRRKDIVKAIRMLFLARDTLPWVVASNAMSTATTTISTIALHYRAEVLQTLKIQTDSRAAFYKASKAMLIVELVAGLCRTLEQQLASRIDRVMAKSLQVRLFLALLAKDTAWWAEQKEAYKYAWMIIDLPSDVQNALQAPRTLINACTSVFIQAALVRSKSSHMLYTMMALHWVLLLLRKGSSYIEQQLHKVSQAGCSSVTEHHMTWVQAINPEYIQMFLSFARGPIEAKNLIKYNCAKNRVDELRSAVNAVMAPVRSVINQLGSVTEHLSMGRLVEQGVVDLTEAETIMHYATDVGRQIECTYYNMSGVQNKFEPLARAYDFISIPSKIDPSVGLDPGERARGHFVFEAVKFGYPGRKAAILNGMSFEVKPGQAVGITGPSGCGKSTCLKLVERFYDVTGGRILLDGRDIREYQPQWLRSQIVAVAQEPKLLPSTIRENLVFACAQKPSLEEIEHACRAANIWEVLKDPQKFPNGLDTKVSALQGVAGGEKQRICIARAVLADPPILLLDEATSALDEVSQAEVQKALNKLMHGRTTLVVAHRLSTIKDSDKIICMNDGKVVDDGTHLELLAKKDSIWKTLWEKQKVEGAQSPQPPLTTATLQIDTTSAGTKYDTLRQAVGAMAELDDADLRQQSTEEIKELINLLEVQCGRDGYTNGHDHRGSPLSTWNGMLSLRGIGAAISALSPRRASATLRALSPKRALFSRSTSSTTSLIRSLTLERSGNEVSDDAQPKAAPRGGACAKRTHRSSESRPTSSQSEST